MKKLLLIGCFAVFAQFASAQIIPGGANLRDLDLQYIEIYPPAGIGGVVRINYGQVNDNAFILADPLIDAEGKPFRNTINALNFLYRNGWELLQTPERNDTYLLKRRKDFEEN